MLASLTLSLVRAPNAHLRLVPAPASAITPMTPLFAQALANVTQYLRATLRPAAGIDLQHQALAWDLACKRRDLQGLDGDSAGAALALGALWLLRDAAPDALRLALGRIPRDALMATTITAALAPQGALAEVGGVGDKADALAPWAQVLQEHRSGFFLHVALEQAASRSALQAQGATLLGHPTLPALVQAVADACEPYTPEQNALHQALLGPGGGIGVQNEVLVQVARKAPMSTLRHYALRCWAQWEDVLGGRVQALFVPLQVAADAAGPLKPLIDRGAFTNLAALLKRHDDSGHAAYVLRGPPGAGKTTLLRHHLQTHCRDALHAWARGEQPAELPLYVPLADLPADQTDPVLWLRERLRREGAPITLLNLLQPHPEPQRRPQLRLLLDGLNELAVPDAQQRAQRAEQVVAALQAGIHSPLPMLLSIRQQHFDSLGPTISLLRVDVQEWTPAAIQAYLQLRFPSPDGAWRPHWQAIEASPQALALCANPMHLAGQCELLEEGFDAPVQDRAALFAAWLWLRLRRELGHSQYQAKKVDQALWQGRRLLSTQDHAAIADDSAWRSTRLRQLPKGGELLRSLMQQAENQYWADAGSGKPGQERCSVAVPWSDVACWLQDPSHPPEDERHDALRNQWADAAAALGLVEVDKVGGSFKFRHQSWGEYLASCNLLSRDPPADVPTTAGPPLATPPWAQRLLAAISPPDLPGGRDMDALRHLQQHAAEGWQAVPQAVWDALLLQGLTVSLDEVYANTLAPMAGESPDARHERWAAHFADWLADNTLTPDRQAGTCRADLHVWGDSTGVQASAGQATQPWQQQPAGWQFLVHKRLWPCYQRELWRWLEPGGGGAARQAGARWPLAGGRPSRPQPGAAAAAAPAVAAQRGCRCGGAAAAAGGWCAAA